MVFKLSGIPEAIPRCLMFCAKTLHKKDTVPNITHLCLFCMCILELVTPLLHFRDTEINNPTVVRVGCMFLGGGCP